MDGSPWPSSTSKSVPSTGVRAGSLTEFSRLPWKALATGHRSQVAMCTTMQACRPCSNHTGKAWCVDVLLIADCFACGRRHYETFHASQPAAHCKAPSTRGGRWHLTELCSLEVLASSCHCDGAGSQVLIYKARGVGFWNHVASISLLFTGGFGQGWFGAGCFTDFKCNLVENYKP